MTRKEYKEKIINLERALKQRNEEITELNGRYTSLYNYMEEIEENISAMKSKFRIPLVFTVGFFIGALITLIRIL